MRIKTLKNRARKNKKNKIKLNLFGEKMIALR